MRYEQYRDALRGELANSPDGLTWAELKTRLRLPYKVPCPEWTRRLEKEIRLTRTPGTGRAYVWRVKPRARPRRVKGDAS